MNLQVKYLFLSLLFFTACQQKQEQPQTEIPEEASLPPNFIIVYNDDMGYGDLGCYGSTVIKTPNIDRLAEGGQRLTNYYVASPVCSPSRAALLTGCYPKRVGIPEVLAPHGIEWAKDRWRYGLHPDEETLPELLKKKGYATALFGKWHLGHMPEHLPFNHGFDRFYGLPYSNDMRPENGQPYPPLPLIEDSVIVAESPDQSQFTKNFTQRALQFMEANKETPFFLYLAHPMPHVPIFASEEFKGKSENGLYGDVIEEIDHSVGELMNKLEELGIRENTVLIITSDNGPWLSYGNHAGSAGALSEGKFTTMEGGQRVPCVISWPGTIPAKSNDELITNMDWLPTLSTWAEASMPQKQIDGMALSDLFEGKPDALVRDQFLYIRGMEVQAMRSGSWKIHRPHSYAKLGENVGMDGKNGKYDRGEIDWALFDLSKDPGEQYNLAEKQAGLMDSLRLQLEEADSLLTLGLRKPFEYQGETPPVGQLW